jgi:hypothetical protein
MHGKSVYGQANSEVGLILSNYLHPLWQRGFTQMFGNYHSQKTKPEQKGESFSGAARRNGVE